jgi:uncharacterized protein (TIGR02246 family)
VDQEKKRTAKEPPRPTHDAPVQNPEVDAFLNRLNYDLRRPKPGEEAVAAAFQAMQRMAFEADAERPAESDETQNEAEPCPACGGRNRAENRFCSACGISLTDVQLRKSAVQSRPGKGSAEDSGMHHYYHHYHHHFFSSSERMAPSLGVENRPASPASPGKVRVPMAGQSVSRAEAAVRQIGKDWIQAANTKQLDDLVELYLPDALMLRPNVPAVRGTAAIREFFFSALDSGLGEVEMDPIRVELLGDLAYEAGRVKMLVPSVVAGKRREERGKYLMIFSRQTGGEWKIVSDCWSADLSLA